MNSNFLKLNWQDLAKGLIVAVVGAILTGLYQALDIGVISFTWVFWKPIVLTGVTAGVGYLIKNYFSNTDGAPFKAEPK